jgi:hypothetical protein
MRLIAGRSCAHATRKIIAAKAHAPPRETTLVPMFGLPENPEGTQRVPE